MNFAAGAILLSCALFVAMVICLEVGFRLGRRSANQQLNFDEGIGGIEAAAFALLGLLLAFSFAGGMSRLDARNELILRETNAISAAYLRIDLLPSDSQPGMRHLFRQYLDARLHAYSMLPDLKAADQEFARAGENQQKIWSGAVSAVHADSTQNAARLLLPALNEMIEVTTNRAVALHTRRPGLLFFLLILIALLSALLAGYAMAKRGRRSVIHMLVYAAMIAVTVYAIIDLDTPRFGLIRLDTADKAMMKLRDSIH